jgi:hypothetical protein
MSDGRTRDPDRRPSRKTPARLLAAATVLTAAGVWITILAVRPSLLDGFLPAGRRLSQPPGQLAERLSAGHSPFVSVVEIGRSVQGRAIHAIRVGMGPRMVVIVGAIHGSEGNTRMLVEALAVGLADAAKSLPRDASLFFVPELNPDGLATRSRYNAHGVDLNRNWATSNWQSNIAESPEDPPGAGGPSPFSEPETAAFSSWLRSLRQQCTGRLAVIIYHAACPPKGLVQPGYRLASSRQETDPNAATLGQYWSDKVGYEYSPTWPEYPITGEAIHWCAENYITCVDIELPNANDPTDTEVQLHLTTLLGMMELR